MGIKVVGFTKKVDSYQTAAGIMKTDLFRNSCTKTAKKLGVTLEGLITKRQASKFHRGKGIVFKTIMK